MQSWDALSHYYLTNGTFPSKAPFSIFSKPNANTQLEIPRTINEFNQSIDHILIMRS